MCVCTRHLLRLTSSFNIEVRVPYVGRKTAVLSALVSLAMISCAVNVDLMREQEPMCLYIQQEAPGIILAFFVLVCINTV